MPAIRRLSDAPYRKLLPPDFISADGFGITIRHLRMGYLAM